MDLAQSKQNDNTHQVGNEEIAINSSFKIFKHIQVRNYSIVSSISQINQSMANYPIIGLHYSHPLSQIVILKQNKILHVLLCKYFYIYYLKINIQKL